MEKLETSRRVDEDIKTCCPREFGSIWKVVIMNDLKEITILHKLHCKKRLIDKGNTNETNDVWMRQTTHEDALLLEFRKESWKFIRIMKDLLADGLECNGFLLPKAQKDLTERSFAHEFCDSQIVFVESWEVHEGEIGGYLLDPQTPRC